MPAKAWLDGNERDLRVLTDLFSTGDVRVIRSEDHDSYYLSVPDANGPSEEGRFGAVTSLIERINGLARIYCPSHRPVKLTGKYTDSSGNSCHFISVASVPSASAVGTPTIYNVDNPPPDRPSPWPGRLALSDSNKDIAEVLGVLGQPGPLGWADLYKVHEIVRESIAPKKIHDLGWADKTTDSAFTASANLPAVSGLEARHARKKGNPKHTMTIDLGRAYIGDLVAKWMDVIA
ncbi:Uncharacterised protein [Mycobacteroides abscessus subsp. bolletii]|nr:Uncharacterised protein [Mycobacteroides abscessus subsp. bolletii]SKF69540.1 Uncharacterised protein [Mycobacteroides abscessus subsp. bolletii]